MDNLPDELKEEIFKYLPSDDLIKMTQVNFYSKWIIENSPVLMNKLPIYLLDDNEHEFYCENHKFIEPLLESRRKVTRIVVRLRQDKIMKHIGILEKFSDTIRVLDVEGYNFETIDQFRIILRFLGNLKTLNLSHVTFLKPENKFLKFVKVPRLSLNELREFNCVKTDPTIFTLFENNFDIQLKKIRLKCDDRTSTITQLVEMVSQQGKLKTLSLDGVTMNNCDIFNYENFLQCELNCLEIINCSLSREQMRRLMSAIKSQRQLKILKFINCPIPSTMDTLYCYRQIFHNFIEEVHVDITQLTFFHSHQFVNLCVKRLRIYGNFAFENLPIFINFIKIFPNTEKLWLIGDLGINDKYLFHILSTFSHLKELSLPGFSSRVKDSNFSNLAAIEVALQSLTLDYIDSDVKFFGWKNIVSNLKTIEKLVIKRDYGKVSNEIVDVIIKTLKLKHLELGIGVVSEEILRNIVYSNWCNELKVLKIPNNDFKKINVDFKGLFKNNRLLLHLCDAEYFQ